MWNIVTKYKSFTLCRTSIHYKLEIHVLQVRDS